MSLPRLLASVAIVLLSLLSSPAAEPPAEKLAGKKPNIILIITDDQGYGDLSCHGNPVLKTPHLDRLHRESVRFTDFKVSPTCAPTRAALLSGKHEFRSGVTHTILERERLALATTTYPQRLKQAGYATGIFGKWHLGDEAEYRPDRRGFDEVFIHGAGGIGQTYPGSGGDAPKNTYFSPAILHNNRFVKTDGYCTDVFFRQAERWIEEVKDRGPFYCHLATNVPHTPLQCPEGYYRPFVEQGLAEDVARFFGMIVNVDDNIGRLLEKLDKLGIADDTLVIFMTDNGGTIGVKTHNAGMRGQKGSPWRGGVRAASFFRWPGSLPAGKDVDALTAHVDIFPTLLEIAGVPVPADAGLDGRSLTPLLLDSSAEWPQRTLVTHLGRWERGKAAEAKYDHCAVRTERWRLVHPRRGEPKWELYDMSSDPGEQRNVAAEHPEVVADLVARLDRWWIEVQPSLVNEDARGPEVNPFKQLYWEQFGRE